MFRRIEWLIGLIKDDLLIEQVKIVKGEKDFSYLSIYLFIFLFLNFRYKFYALERRLKEKKELFEELYIINFSTELLLRPLL